jgi:hypothetical protein
MSEKEDSYYISLLAIMVHLWGFYKYKFLKTAGSCFYCVLKKGVG